MVKGIKFKNGKPSLTLELTEEETISMLFEQATIFERVVIPNYGEHEIYIGSSDSNFHPPKHEPIPRSRIDEYIEKYKLQEEGFYGEKTPGAATLVLKDSCGFYFVFVYIGKNNSKEDQFEFVYSDSLF